MKRITYKRNSRINEEDMFKNYNFSSDSLNDYDDNESSQETSGNEVANKIEELVIGLIKRLEGYCLRLKEFHWSANHKSLHELTDTVISSLCEFEDEIAEECMGLSKNKFKVETFESILPDATTPGTLLNVIYDDILNVRNSVDELKKAPGFVSTCDDMLKSISKYSYLETFV